MEIMKKEHQFWIKERETYSQKLEDEKRFDNISNIAFSNWLPLT